MTEQHPSFGGVAVADPRATTSPLDLGTEVAADDNRRKLALAGAAVAVVVLLIAAFFMLKGKGGTDAAFVPPHVVPPAHSAQSSTAAAAPKPIKLPKPFHGVVGRDPFKALYVIPPVKAPTVAPAVPVTSAGNPVVTPTGSGTVPTQTNPGGSATAGDSNTPVWIELDSFTSHGPTFRVMYGDGIAFVYRHVQVPKSGKTTVFASSFSLLSVHDGVATVQLGDGTPFRMKPGYDNRHFFG